MTQTAYKRADLERLQVQAVDAAAHPRGASNSGIRWFVLPISMVLCVAQSILTILASNIRDSMITSTLIPVVAFAILLLVVLVGNPMMRLGRAKSLCIAAAVILLTALAYWLVDNGPLAWNGFWSSTYQLMSLVSFAVLFFAMLRLVGARPFNRAELTCVFAAMTVTAGISTFGLTEQLVPLITAPFNPEWNTPLRGWGDPLLLKINPKLYITDPGVIHTFREGMPPKTNLPWGEYFSYCKNVFFKIPWGAWLPPLGYWMIFIGACYAAFYSLTYVVLGYWSDREKLIFPLAKMSEALLPEDEGRLPALLRTPGFWAGFAASFLVLTWNAFVSAGWIAGGLTAIPLGMGHGAFETMVAGSKLEGLGGGTDMPMMFLIMFTAIGISFLLPLEISFSAWFYFLVGKCIILIHVWLGYGRTGADYPTDWVWLNNPMTALGGGGLFLFAAVSLFRCFKDYLRLIAGRSVADRIRIGVPVIGLVASMAVVMLWLQWNRIPLVWAFIFIIFLTLLTVGLMRIVAEGGIYWYQSHASFFHVYKMFGWGKYLAPPLLGPLIPIYSVLFLDIKTFMAPNLLNAGSMQKDVGGSRTKFHLNIVLCILCSVVVSIVFAIFLAHLRGGQQMESWFYQAGPPYMIDMARDASKAVSAYNPVTIAWWAIGAVWVAVSLYLRTSLFWFPHPIGFVMLINPLMAQLWFSFFIGWLCKKITVKYGGKTTFDKVRGVFIGLILGELTAIFIYAMISMVSGAKIPGVTLNRYS